MHNYTREDILRLVEEEDVAFIRLQFTDIFGTMKNMAVTVSQLQSSAAFRCVFSRRALRGRGLGYVSLSGSELRLRYFRGARSRARWRALICDVYRTDGTPYEVDPRYVLKKAIAHARRTWVYA